MASNDRWMKTIQKEIESVSLEENMDALQSSSKFIKSLDKFLKDFGKTLSSYNELPKTGGARDAALYDTKQYNLFLKQLTKAYYWVEKIREHVTGEKIDFHLGYVEENGTTIQIYEKTYTLEDAIRAGIFSAGRMSSKKGGALKLMGSAEHLIKNAAKTEVRDQQRLKCYEYLLQQNGNSKLGLPKLNKGQLFEAYIIASNDSNYKQNIKNIFIQAKNVLPFFAGADIDLENENWSIKAGPRFSIANSHTLYKLLLYIKTILTNPSLAKHSKELLNLVFTTSGGTNVTYAKIFKALNMRITEIEDDVIKDIKEKLQGIRIR